MIVVDDRELLIFYILFNTNEYTPAEIRYVLKIARGYEINVIISLKVSSNTGFIDTKTLFDINVKLSTNFFVIPSIYHNTYPNAFMRPLKLYTKNTNVLNTV